MKLPLRALLTISLCTAQLTGLVKHAFTADECDTIIELFLSMDSEEDVRHNPLLPQMESSLADPFRVARINRFDDGSRKQQVNAIHQRIMLKFHDVLLDHVPPASVASIEAFSAMIQFTLLHEFTSKHNGFDWCVHGKAKSPFNASEHLSILA